MEIDMTPRTVAEKILGKSQELSKQLREQEVIDEQLIGDIAYALVSERNTAFNEIVDFFEKERTKEKPFKTYYHTDKIIEFVRSLKSTEKKI